MESSEFEPRPLPPQASVVEMEPIEMAVYLENRRVLETEARLEACRRELDAEKRRVFALSSAVRSTVATLETLSVLRGPGERLIHGALARLQLALDAEGR